MSCVLRIPRRLLRAPARTVLTILAHHASDETWGDAFPGEEKLAEECGLATRTVRKCKLILEDNEWILRTGRSRYGTVKYDINRAKIEPIAEAEAERERKNRSPRRSAIARRVFMERIESGE